jgi:plasmid stability protein
MMEIPVQINDEAVLAFWAMEAARHGRSVNEELGVLVARHAIIDATLDEQARIQRKNAALKQMNDLREEIRAQHGNLPDITQMIREERDLRG